MSALLRDGLAQAWGPLETVASAGDVAILRAAPGVARPWFSLVTAGLGVGGEAPIELVTYAADEGEWAAAMLLELAALAPTGMLQPYQPLTLSAPPSEYSTLTGVVLLPPYFEPAEPAGVSLLWAVPVTTAELELAILAGGGALEAVLVEADLGPAPDLERASVV